MYKPNQYILIISNRKHTQQGYKLYNINTIKTET